MAIPYRTTKLKSANILIFGLTAKFNSHQYFWLYGIIYILHGGILYLALSVHNFLLLPECTDLIMEDAKKKKDEWTQRLSRYEVESLLSLRDTLLARGSMLTMTSADIKEIIRKIKSTVS